MFSTEKDKASLFWLITQKLIACILSICQHLNLWLKMNFEQHRIKYIVFLIKNSPKLNRLSTNLSKKKIKAPRKTPSTTQITPPTWRWKNRHLECKTHQLAANELSGKVIVHLQRTFRQLGEINTNYHQAMLKSNPVKKVTPFQIQVRDLSQLPTYKAQRKTPSVKRAERKN